MDLLELAKKRRAAVAKEVEKLDQFIAMGEELAKSAGEKAPRSETEKEQSSSGNSEEREPMPLRQFAAGGSSRS